MKVIKLNEASLTGAVSNWENQFNSASSIKDQADVVKTAMNDIDIPDNIISAINKFGDAFLVKWIQALRWDELGRDNNDFILLLKNPNLCTQAVKNMSNFTKLYNAYAAGWLVSDYFDDKIYSTLLRSGRLYNFDQSDVTRLLQIYDRLKTNNNNLLQRFSKDLSENEDREVSEEEALANIFFENVNNSSNIDEIINSDLNTPARIKEILNMAKDGDFKVTSDDDEVKSAIDNYIKEPKYVSYMKQELAKLKEI